MHHMLRARDIKMAPDYVGHSKGYARCSVIDGAAGEKIPRKGGPGITKSDLFVINKTDLAPYVGANLEVMREDTVRMRSTAKGLKPFVMTNLKTNTGLAEVMAFIESKGMLRAG